MIKLTYNKTDLRYVFVFGNDKKELSALEAHLNKIPSFMFLPSFSGVKRPEVFLHKFRKDDKVYYYADSGLWKEIVDWCKENNVECEGVHDDSYFKYYGGFTLTEEQFTIWVKSIGLSIEPRQYQIHAAYLILKYRQSLSQLATRSGKTLIAYMVFRWLLENGARSILMVVPNTSLVKQGVKDMDEYAPFFKSEAIWSGGELCEGANLTIGTFQSLVKRADKKSKKYDSKFFDKYDVVCCDECHTAKCKSIQLILSQNFMKYVKVRFGFSGTLPSDYTIESYCVQSLLGPCIQDISSKELQDAGYIANADVTQVRIKYDYNEQLKDLYVKCGEYLVGNYVTDGKSKLLLPKEERSFTMQHVKKLPYAVETVKKQLSKEDYIDYLVDLCKAQGSNLLMLEQMIVHRSERRMRIIDTLIDEMQGNVVVFAHHTAYISALEAHLKNSHLDRVIYTITGSTSIKKRQSIQEDMLKNNNVILVASYACVGTGLTFKNLDCGIFAQSFKSQIINKQAIGRGLLRAESKDTFYLYDLIDELPTKRLQRHGDEKAKLWKREGFIFRLVNM